MSLDGGEALLQACRDLGADYVFSSAGSEWAPVWEALARAERDAIPGPRYLDLTHETLAVGMATGYGLVTGRAQVVLLHAAAGLLQGANAIHGALLAGVPMVVCSGESTGYGDAAGPDPGSQWYRNLSVVGGPQGVAAPFTKWSNTAADVAVVRGMVTRAAELAAAPPAGPVYVNVPVEVLLAPWAPRGGRRVPPVGATVASEADLDVAVRMLAAARRPVVVTESGGRTTAQWAALLAFAETVGAPVVEPQSAVCANFSRRHPLHGGGDAADAAADADLVVLLSCRAPWYPPSAVPDGIRTLVVDDVPQRPHVAYQVLDADAYVRGDTALTLGALTRRLREIGVPDSGVVEERRTAAVAVHEARERDRRAAEERAAGRPDGPVDPVALAVALRETLPEDAVVVDETITHSRLLVQHLMADQPGRYYYVQGGLGQGSGWALGVKLAVGERLVVLTVGDGSLLYNPFVQALMASRVLGLPLLVVVFTNGSYLSMRHNHVRSYPDGAAVSTGRFFGVSLDGQPDPAAIARACGAHGVRVDTAHELPSALKEAVEVARAGQPAVVSVHLTR
ncbi:MAG TPA: thiamine pyrophosphate-dependent enzyme [Actinomycetes bacterium]|nr:thiamine pyrophosphate-dependent enzyme [Actinomycetes bacterium]